MPTPRESDAQSQPLNDSLDRSAHTACPVENERSGGPRGSDTSFPNQSNLIDDDVSQQQDSTHSDYDVARSSDSINHQSIKTKTTIKDRDSPPTEGLSPMSVISEPREIDLQESSISEASNLGASYPINYGIDDTRVCGFSDL